MRKEIKTILISIGTTEVNKSISQTLFDTRISNYLNEGFEILKIEYRDAYKVGRKYHSPVLYAELVRFR